MANRYERFKATIKGKADTYVDYIPILNPSAELVRLTDVDALLNSFSNILRTPRGTDIEDPNYGTDISSRIFDTADDITIDSIITDITEAAEIYDNRINITGIDVSFLESGKKGFTVDVEISFRDELRTNSLYYDEDHYFQFFTQEDN